MAGYQPATSFMAMPKLAEATFYGVSVLDGCSLSMPLLSSTRGPKVATLSRADSLPMSFNPPPGYGTSLFAFLPSTSRPSGREKAVSDAFEKPIAFHTIT